jgi:hypothetical protein
VRRLSRLWRLQSLQRLQGLRRLRESLRRLRCFEGLRGLRRLRLRLLSVVGRLPHLLESEASPLASTRPGCRGFRAACWPRTVSGGQPVERDRPACTQDSGAPAIRRKPSRNGD